MSNINLNNKNVNFSFEEIDKNKIPKKLEFIKYISEDSFNFYEVDNSFVIFKSIDNRNYIAFSTKNSIIVYNLNNQQIENEIKYPHEYFITSLRHCIYNKKNIIMTVSPSEENIKLWDLSNCENITNINNIYSNPYLFSACFLNNNNQNYILSSSCSNGNPEPIIVFDFNGNKIKEINNSKDITYSMDIYYDNYSSKCYIITGNLDNLKAYDYGKNEVYHKYISDGEHYKVIIYQEDTIIKMLESSNKNNFIKIWDFHKGLLLNKIEINNAKGNLRISLLNEKYLFIGDFDGKIKIFDLKKGDIINDELYHQSRICSIKKLMHPLYGECIISQGWLSEPIKLWAIKY